MNDAASTETLAVTAWVEGFQTIRDGTPTRIVADTRIDLQAWGWRVFVRSAC